MPHGRSYLTICYAYSTSEGQTERYTESSGKSETLAQSPDIPLEGRSGVSLALLHCTTLCGKHETTLRYAGGAADFESFACLQDVKMKMS